MKKSINILLVLCAVLVLYFGTGKLVRMIYPTTYEEIVREYANEYGVDETFVFAVIKAESNFKAEAVSNKNAIGLMQIMEPTAEWIAAKIQDANLSSELTDPKTNIRMGTYYISYLLDLYDGDKTCALAAYNAGCANVDSWLLSEKNSKNGKTLSRIPFPETEKYVNIVLRNEKIYQYLYGDET